MPLLHGESVHELLLQPFSLEETKQNRQILNVKTPGRKAAKENQNQKQE
jgi:hypothetical protein